MSSVASNPSLLKLDLAAHGAQVDRSVPPELLRRPESDALASSIELLLPQEVLSRVPLDEAFARTSPYRLVSDEERLWITSSGARSEVRVIPHPAYYGKATSSGMPMWRVGTASGNHIVINPGRPCGTTRRGTACRFCDVETQTTPRSEPLPIADVIETVAEAFAEGAVELVYLHAGTQGAAEDAGAEFLEPYVHAIKKHFDTLIAVQLLPPSDNRWIDRTYAMGVDALSYSVEIHDAALLERHCAGHAQAVERERYYEALRYAAAIFPSGTVWSDLRIGLEPPASTIAGVDTLVSMNVLPVLSLCRPGEDHGRGAALPIAEELTPVLAHLFNAVRSAKINMNWVRDLSDAVTPIEARFFSPDGAALSVSGQFYRSRIGGLAARNLSRMRRRLRVRKVSDSFDASHL